jgi:PAS domain S-box-containing protein
VPLILAGLVIVSSALPACLSRNSFLLFASSPMLVLIACLSLRPRLPSIYLGIVTTAIYVSLGVLRIIEIDWTTGFVPCVGFIVGSWFIVYSHRRQRAEFRRRIRTRDRLTGYIKRQGSQLREFRGELEKATISERTANQAVLDTRAQQSDLITNLEVHVFHKNLDGEFTFVSDSFAKLLKTTPAQVVGRSDADFFPISLATKYRHDDQEILNNGVPYDDVEENQSPDGTTRYMRVRKAPLRDRAGNVIGLQGMFWDITESFAASIELRKNTVRKRALFSAALDGILLLGDDLSILEINPSASSLFGFTTMNSAIGSAFSDLVSSFETTESSKTATVLVSSFDTHIDRTFPSSQRVTKESVTHVLDGIENRRIQAQFKRQGESDFAGEMTARPIEAEDQSGWAVFVRDISKRRTSELELLEAKERAEAANRAKDAFLTNVSHELRTPLTGIRSIAELLEASTLAPQQQLYVSLLEKSSSGLSALIDDLLDFSKMDAHHLELSFERYDWPAFLESCVMSLAARAQQRSLELVLDIDPDSPRIVFGDKQRVEQVIANLIGNSIKFTEDGEIVLSSRRHRMRDGRDAIQIEISDTGIGVPADKVEAIFAPFQQADSSMTRRFGGTGLGLAISRQLIELSGGTIECRPRQTRGTTFTIELPIVAPDAMEVEGFEEFDFLNSKNRVATDRRAIEMDATAREIWIFEGNQTQRTVLLARLHELELSPRVFDSADDLLAALNALTLPNQGPDVRRPIALADLRGITIDQLTKHQGLADWILLLPMSLPLPESLQNSMKNMIQLPLKTARLDSLVAQYMTSTMDLFDTPTLPTKSRKVQQTARVLLVEDSTINREILQAVLKKLGHDVVSVKDGQQAVDTYKEQNFDLILMDIQMPVLDGISATKQIREYESTANRYTSIFALTAHAFEEDRKATTDAGMDRYLVKPIKMEILRNYIDEVLLRSSRPESGSIDAGRDLDGASHDKSAASATTATDAASVSGTNGLDDEFEQGLVRLKESALGDEKLVGDLLSAFCKEVPPLFSTLIDAMETGDLELGKRASHTIKSNLRYFGIQSLETKLGEIEKQCRQGVLDGARQNVELVSPRLREFMNLVARQMPGTTWHQ